MPTSAAQLLDAVIVVANARGNPNVGEADAAVRALAHLGRALERLDAPAGGAESVGEARRALITRELAGSIRSTVVSWPAGGDHLTDLAGVAADLISTSLAVNARGLTAEQRWAATVMLARAIEQCAAAATRFPPYAAVPTLIRVRRHSELAGRLSKLDPPAAVAGAWLDRCVPASGPPSRSAADMTLVDAAVGLVTSLERELGNGTLHVYALLAASAAAETLATHARSRLPDAARRSGPPAVHGWRVLQRALSYLDDGSRYSSAPASRVTEHAFALTTQLRAGQADAPQRSSLPEIRFAVTQLSRVADLVELAVSRRAEAGRLLARARVLPRSQDRVADVVADRVVVVKPSDVTAVAFAAGATARLSAALAVDLDRSAELCGPHPQPGLLASLREQLRPELSARDVRWARGLAARIDATPLPPAHAR